jgi:transposase-like protein
MQMSVRQFEAAFPNEDACDAYLVARRWPNGVRCPRCNSDRVYPLKSKAWHWECPDCRQGGAYRFSDIAGTIFENTNVDLRQWFRVIHLMLTAKTGISARQVHRFMGFGSYKTAWHMCHRIRSALVDPNFRKLMGIVEVDETHVGGSDANKPKRLRGKNKKTFVAGAAERGGPVVARAIKRIDARTMNAFINEAISTKVSLVATDEARRYELLHERMPHGLVNHSKGQYVSGLIHTGTIDTFWSLLKRRIMGSVHKVSQKYLPLYVAEFEFRYNNRHNPDIFGAAVGCC